MTTIDSTNTAKIRSRSYAASNVIVNIPRASVGTHPIMANIDTPLPTLPEGTYAVKNEYADWEDGLAGMLVRVIREGVGIVWTGVLRYGNQFGSVHLAGRNTGDTGQASYFGYDIEEDDLVIVYRIFVPYAFWSRVEPTDLTQLKFWDLDYVDQNEFPPPQINLGEHQCLTVPPGDTDVEVVMTAANANAPSFNWRGGALSYTNAWKTISPPGTYSGEPVTGNTFTTDRAPGQYLVRCRVVSTSGTGSKVSESYRWIFVRGATFQSFSDLFPTVIESDESDETGRRMTLLVRATSLTSIQTEYLYQGAPVLVTYTSEYSDDDWRTVDTVDEGILTDNFYGYLRRVESLGQNAEGLLTFRLSVVSPSIYMADLPNARQTLIVAPTGQDPANWNQLSSNLASTSFVSWYLIRWSAPTIINHSDFVFTYAGTNISRNSPAYDFPQGSLLDGVTRAIRYYSGANIGSISSGGLYLRRHPSYENDTYRNTTLDTVWTVLPEDLIGEGDFITVNEDKLMASYETRAKFIDSGTALPLKAFAARTNLFAPAQAVRSTELESFIANGESDGLQRLGHYGQWLNRPIKSFSVPLQGGRDFIEPALREWYAFDMDTLTPSVLQNAGINRTIATKVVRQWDFSGLSIIKRLSVTFEPESAGLPAQLDPVNLGSVYGQWSYSWKFAQDDGDWDLYMPGSSLNFSPSEMVNNTNRGSYVSGKGWQGEQFLKTGTPWGNYRAALMVKRTFSQAALTSIYFKFKSPNNTGENLNLAMAFYYTPGGVQTQRTATPGYGTVEYTATFPKVTVNAVGIAILVHHTSVYPTLPVLKQVVLGGEGSGPF